MQTHFYKCLGAKLKKDVNYLILLCRQTDISLFRDQTSGKFRPMSEVDCATKFCKSRGNRRDFPDAKEKGEIEYMEEGQED